MFVHDAVVAVNIGIGVRRLGDEAHGEVRLVAGVGVAGRTLPADQARHEKGVEARLVAHGHGAGIDRAQAALGPVAGGNVDNTLVAQIIVVGMTDQHAAVFGCAGRDNGGSATRVLGHGRQAHILGWPCGCRSGRQRGRQQQNRHDMQDALERNCSLYVVHAALLNPENPQSPKQPLYKEILQILPKFRKNVACD